jgi:hypothetical protein
MAMRGVSAARVRLEARHSGQWSIVRVVLVASTWSNGWRCCNRTCSRVCRRPALHGGDIGHRPVYLELVPVDVRVVVRHRQQTSIQALVKSAPWSLYSTAGTPAHRPAGIGFAPDRLPQGERGLRGGGIAQEHGVSGDHPGVVVQHAPDPGLRRLEGAADPFRTGPAPREREGRAAVVRHEARCRIAGSAGGNLKGGSWV